MVFDIDATLSDAGIKLLFFTRMCFQVGLVNGVGVLDDVLVTES